MDFSSDFLALVLIKSSMFFESMFSEKLENAQEGLIFQKINTLVFSRSVQT